MVIGALIVLLLNLYIGNIHSGQNQIAALAETLSIRADVTNPNGSQVTALSISDETVRFLEASAHTKNLRYTVMLMGGYGTFAPEDWKEHLTLEFTAVNALSAVPNLTADSIAYLEGTDDEFLQGDQPLCLVYEEIARHYGLSVGDTVQFTLYYIQYPSSYAGKISANPLGVFDLTIAGIVWPTVWDSGAIEQSIILPVRWVRGAYEENGVAFSPTSASFTVADPLRLNAFKSEMQAFGLLETDTTAASSYQGNALKVDDKVFITTVNILEANQNRLWFFLPFILVILVVTGYLTSYLLMRGRQREFAVMRSLGTGTRACFHIFMLENTALALCAALLGALPAALLIPGADAGVLLLSAGAFCACNLLGTAIALLGFGRFSVMDALCQTD